jgi:hypothetical protein
MISSGTGQLPSQGELYLLESSGLMTSVKYVKTVEFDNPSSAVGVLKLQQPKWDKNMRR